MKNKVLVLFALMPVIVLSISSGYITVQATQANATQYTTITGCLQNTSSLNSSIKIDFSNITEVSTRTDSGGCYNTQIQIPETIATGTYQIKVNATDLNLENQTSIEVKGRTETELDVPAVVSAQVDKAGNGQVAIPYSLAFKYNLPQAKQIICTLFSQQKISVAQNDNFLYQINNSIPAGTYNFTVIAKWGNDDGTVGNVTKKGVVVIPEVDAFEIQTASIDPIVVGTKIPLPIKIISSSNKVQDISFLYKGDISNTWLTLPQNVSVNPGESKIVKGFFSIPYTAKGGDYSILLIASSPSTSKTATVNFKVIEPKFEFVGFNNSYTITNNPNITLIGGIKNIGQTDIKLLNINITKPEGWNYTISSNKVQNLSKGDMQNLTIKLNIENPQSIITKQIIIDAFDGAGREAKKTISFKIKAQSTELVGKQIKIYSINGPSFLDTDYYLLGNDSLIKTQSLANLTGTDAVPSVRRESEMTAWEVKVLNKSVGVGDVCSPYLVIDGTVYDLTKAYEEGTSLALVGKINDPAYEVYQFHKIGKCEVYFDYGKEQTETHIFLSGPNPTPSLKVNASYLAALKKEITEENQKRDNEYMKYFLLGIIGLLATIWLISSGRKGISSVVYHDSVITKDVNRFNDLINGGKKNGDRKQVFYDFDE